MSSVRLHSAKNEDLHMKITVINGSPKGDNSITLFTAKYLQKKYPEHEFSFISAAARIKTYEKSMDEADSLLADAELILFSYPVYTFIVPSQLHRFIELIKMEISEGRLSLEGKYVSQISTSKHFYDVTAHKFIEENCLDMKMKHIRGLSADMEDLTKEKGQKDAQKFFEYILWNISREKKKAGAAVEKTADISSDGIAPVVIIADISETDNELKSMIEYFREKLGLPSKVVNIRNFHFKGGCQGCLKCAATGKCIYNDGFENLLRDEIQNGSAAVYAFTIQDHSMGSLFKTYDDRQFCNGHRTVTMGSPVAYLIHGEYSKEQNLRLILEARAETGGNFFAGAASDENGNIEPEELKRQIEKTAANVRYSIENKYAPPSNFFSVGGMKIFRDLIYQMRGFMKADHKFFKKNGQYDFPQKKKGTILMMYLVGALFSSEKAMKKMGNKMNEGMMMPYQKVLDKMDEK